MPEATKDSQGTAVQDGSAPVAPVSGTPEPAAAPATQGGGGTAGTAPAQPATAESGTPVAPVAAEPQVVPIKRFKDTQGDLTRANQELARLRKELDAKQAAQPAPAVPPVAPGAEQKIMADLAAGETLSQEALNWVLSTAAHQYNLKIKDDGETEVTQTEREWVAKQWEPVLLRAGVSREQLPWRSMTQARPPQSGTAQGQQVQGLTKEDFERMLDEKLGTALSSRLSASASVQEAMEAFDVQYGKEFMRLPVREEGHAQPNTDVGRYLRQVCIANPGLSPEQALMSYLPEYYKRAVRLSVESDVARSINEARQKGTPFGGVRPTPAPAAVAQAQKLTDAFAEAAPSSTFVPPPGRAKTVYRGSER